LKSASTVSSDSFPQVVDILLFNVR